MSAYEQVGRTQMGQVLHVNQIEGECQELRRRGLSVVLTNGHFDLLHTGHTRYLQQAKALGDVLIVGINDDATTRTRKGPRRPIMPENERAELIAALDCVDYTVIFHEPTADHLISLVQPDIYVKGGDYTVDPDGPGALLPEASTVREFGGEVQILDLEPGQSTSAIEQRIIERWQQNGHEDL
jgi:D-glycero-beta-D-manno-heptose 1-phosphate adenylyltransferase